MTAEFENCLSELERRGLLPDEHRAVYVSGSIARGWGNETSDLDIYVITPEPWTGDGEASAPVALEPNSVPIGITHVNKVRWDIEYWSEGQVEQLVRKVSWASFDSNPKATDLMTSPMQHELNFLERLPYAVPLAGEEWLLARREEVASSALRSLATSAQLNLADAYLEDAVGQLKASDLESSVLSAKMAFGHSVDALLAYNGEVGRSWKWRARRFHEVEQDVLTFERYWALETMRDFDPESPARWVEEVVQVCRSISFEVVL
ncbi:nucleotidyltransferase domain-containing protein [Streptomyces sp. EN23]|uniref:nucleotidyltransferase domain-containing protein n=1 Tax=Streptomyces sp. EN23 TaxID=212774 RepID=UPI0008516036|nr:nucleotidyltransferase domain-containing protein [Streptomyces sp. EN23]